MKKYKVSSVPALHPFLISNLISVLLVIAISILPFSLYKHHNDFFLSIYDFIVAVKSSRVAVFFIFNAILIAIFYGSFKPNFKKDYDRYCCIPVSSTPAHYQAYHYHHQDVKEEANGQDDYDDDDDDDFSSENDLYHGNISDGYDEDDDDDGDGDDSDDWQFGSEDGYGYDDEEIYIDLQRRSEEFIAKNNKRWIEELRNERFLCIAAATEILTSSSS